MMRHDWPGNVRELENSVERACALSSGPVLHLATCPPNSSSRAWRRAAAWPPPVNPPPRAALRSVATLADLERQAILGAIRALNGDKLQAAKLLGIGKTTLYRKLKEYGIVDPLREE